MTFLTRALAAVALPLVVGGTTAATDVTKHVSHNRGADDVTIQIQSSGRRGANSLDDSGTRGREVETMDNRSNDSIVSASTIINNNELLNSSNSGLETEVEHGVTTLVPHNRNGVSSSNSTDDSSQGMEVEVEHGVMTLVPHGGGSDDLAGSQTATASDDSTVVSNSGLEVEVEHGVTTLVPHGGNDNSVVLSQPTGAVSVSQGLETEVEHGVVTQVPHGGGGNSNGGNSGSGGGRGRN